MRAGMPHRSHLAVLAVAVLSLVAPGCSAEPARDHTGVAGTAVLASGLDPVELLADVSGWATAGWHVSGGPGPVEVTVDDLRPEDAERAARYAEAGFQAGARLSLVRGEADRMAVMVDRFPHAAAARQVEDWHRATRGGTWDGGVSRVGATAEGVMVIEDLLVRVVAVGAVAPDEAAVRDVLAAVHEAVLPRR